MPWPSPMDSHLQVQFKVCVPLSVKLCDSKRHEGEGLSRIQHLFYHFSCFFYFCFLILVHSCNSQVFRTSSQGWGVQTMEHIKSHKFLFELADEIVIDGELIKQNHLVQELLGFSQSYTLEL